MDANGRIYSKYIDSEAITSLENLITTKSSEIYQLTMIKLGAKLGTILDKKLPKESSCLVASTAEDADYLTQGILNSLKPSHKTMAAVFWNNHYKIPDGESVAPVVHQYLEPGYDEAKSLVVAKSIISGSCVVRTNILFLIEKLKVEKIYIVAPIIHNQSEQLLRKEFPEGISSLFEFIFLAEDSFKDDTGEVKPGIGGQIYKLLGMEDQPARTSFMPKLVRDLVF